MLTLNDGRSELWQWDTGRKLSVDADCSQVHFSNKVFGRSIDVDVVDGIAIIPDILLQTDKELTAWAFVGTAENGYTKISKVFKVNKRNKPADYVFTPTDQTTLGELVERLEKIEETQDSDAIKNAVYDYLASNPIQIDEKDPTVPDWAKQPEPPKVEIPEVNIPTTLPNPHALTFTGAVEATYDGRVPVEVVIPQGGGGTGTWELIGEVVSDGAGENYGIYLPIDLTPYKEVYIEAVDTASSEITYRVALSWRLSWSEGAVLTSVKRAEKVMHSIRITIINGEMKIIAATNSGYAGGTSIACYNSPRNAMKVGYKYIRVDTNNAGAVPEGVTLKAWGYK